MGLLRTRFLAAMLGAALLSPLTLSTAAAQPRAGVVGGFDYDRGYRDGLRRGEQDGRQGRDFDRFRGSTGDEFRRGFADGYRVGYERTFRQFGSSGRNDRRNDGRRLPGGYQEPAYARGYSDGYTRGQADGRNGGRYDPVRERDYRDGDNGYFGSYGPRDAYRNNYRAGFRQGYEGGYRDGQRYRR